MKRFINLIVCSLFLITSFAAVGNIFAQVSDKPKKLSGESKKARQDSLQMLDEMKGIIKRDYYDANFRGIDLDARFKAAEERIKSLEYNWQMYRVLVQVLMDFNDSHTRFQLPPRTDYFDYGFSMQMFGSECFITSVKKDSDADKKGLAVGDKIINIGKYAPSRQHLWKIVYVLYRLDPADTVDLKIEKLDGSIQDLTVKAKTMTRKERREELKKKKSKEKFEPYKCREVSSQLIACKLYTFVTEKNTVDKMLKEARNYKKMILDLRGNGGGFVSTEEYMVGHFFDKDVKIADMITRKKTELRMAESRGDKVFKGDLIVLLDSNSASASEIFARVIQIEKRGKIIGDTSKGAVMTSIYRALFSPASAFAAVVWSSVGMSVTIGDVVMRDGSRIENVGVIPDVPMVPNGLALSKKTDPVLAYAATVSGAELSPEKAGEFYFITQKDDDEDLENVDEDN
jgi:C-terminal processing protease CtpA/Prc